MTHPLWHSRQAGEGAPEHAGSIREAGKERWEPGEIGKTIFKQRVEKPKVTFAPFMKPENNGPVALKVTILLH